MTLTDFLPENDIETRRGAGNPGMIALADLRSRRVPVEWFEAVAVVQGVCRASLDSRVDVDKLSIGAKHVSLGPDGSVHLAQNTSQKGESPIRQIGELLRTSLAESAFPVPLRLVITQACSTPPFYASIAELSSALEYFERPGRTGLVRSVYERAQGCQPVAGAVAQETPPEPWAEKPNRKPRRIPKRALAAAGAAVTLLAAWVVVSRLPARQQVDGPVAEIVSTVGALVDRVNPFTASSSSESPSPSPNSPKTIGPSLRRNPTQAGSRVTHSSTEIVQPAVHAEPPPAADVSPGNGLPMSDASETRTGEALVTGAAVDTVAEAMIYSSNDRDVIPPVAAYPRLPAEAPARVAAEDRSTLELLVDETGHVESVKLRGQPRHLGEALLVTMNLSAAKTWRFLPAVKEGRPVKYRKLVQIWPTAP